VSTYAIMEGSNVSGGKRSQETAGWKDERAANSYDAPCQDMLTVVLHSFV
jgi:hypothetical protein